jgi:hypothetical protein
MDDMSLVIVPKSDQLNADDLISGPKTIEITRVEVSAGKEQPVSMHYVGGDGRPYKPCKSMCKVMVMAWGNDAKKYAGRSLTLFRDPSVTWGGMAVGGIRISHMSHINGPQTFVLTMSKTVRRAYKVLPLDAPARDPVTLQQALDLIAAIHDADTRTAAQQAIKAIRDDNERATARKAYDDKIAAVRAASAPPPKPDDKDDPL